MNIKMVYQGLQYHEMIRVLRERKAITTLMGRGRCRKMNGEVLRMCERLITIHHHHKKKEYKREKVVQINLEARLTRRWPPPHHYCAVARRTASCGWWRWML